MVVSEVRAAAPAAGHVCECAYCPACAFNRVAPLPTCCKCVRQLCVLPIDCYCRRSPPCFAMSKVQDKAPMSPGNVPNTVRAPPLALALNWRELELWSEDPTRLDDAATHERLVSSLPQTLAVRSTTSSRTSVSRAFCAQASDARRAAEPQLRAVSFVPVHRAIVRAVGHRACGGSNCFTSSSNKASQRPSACGPKRSKSYRSSTRCP